MPTGWDRIKSTGKGRIRARLVIAGLPDVWVTHPAMEQTTGGRTWRSGLKTEGITITERCNPLHVIPELAGATFRIVDVDGAATRAFARRPTKVTWLTDDLPVAGTTATVASETGWVAGDYAHIGLESILVGGTSTAQLTGLTRAQWDTIALAHYKESDELRLTEVTNYPRTLTGRDVRLYLYGDGDSPTGTGTLVWLGVVSEEPRLESDGVTWVLQADNVVRLLAQTLGEGLKEPLPVRGIRYAVGCRLVVRIVSHTSASILSADEDTASVEIPDGDGAPAFYEDQAAFCDDLTDKIATAVSGFTQVPTIRAEVDGDQWRLVVQTAATPRYIQIEVHSPIDGETDHGVLYDEDDNRILSVSATTVYYVRWRPRGEAAVENPRRVPRGAFNDVSGAGDGRARATSDFGQRTLFLGGGDVSLTGVATVIVDWPAFDGRDSVRLVHSVLSVDTGTRSITLSSYAHRAAWSGKPPTVKLTRRLTSASVGHIGNVVTQLLVDALTESTRGGSPWVSGNHLGNFSTVVEEAARGRPVVLRRAYSIGSDIELEELFKHELRLLGLWLGFNSTGTLVPLPLLLPTPTDPDVIDVKVLRDPRPTWQAFKVGTLGGAIVKTSYEPYEDEWIGSRVTVKDPAVFSRNPLASVVEVNPRSFYQAGAVELGDPRDATTPRDIASLLAPLIGAYGYPYQIVQFDVPFTAWDVRLGDGVRFDSSFIPDVSDGSRGVTDAVGLVVGRTVDLRAGRITLEVHMWGADVRGYAPAMGITAQANVAGNKWDLTVDFKDPWSVADWDEGGDIPSDHFAAGDAVEVYKWNNATPSVLSGTIDSVTDPATIQVTFTGAWTPGSDKWVLRYQSVNAADASMQRYAYWVGADRRIDFSPAVEARVFAP